MRLFPEKNGEGFVNHSINQEDPYDEKVCNSNCANSLLLSLSIFVDLIIREVAEPLSPNRPFYRFILRH